MWPRLALALLAFVLAVTFTAPASAHATLTSTVVLDLHEGSVEADLQLPVDQLDMAMHEAHKDAAVRDYLGQHLSLVTMNDQRYGMVVRSLASAKIDDSEYVVAKVLFTAPAGATRESTQTLTLFDDAIVDRVITHRVLVSLRRDFDQALFGDTTKLLGVSSYSDKRVVIDRASGSAWRGFRAVFALGVQHIAEGTDHLLFLLVLLLSAPLALAGRRWGAARAAKTTVRHALSIVSLFTLGHCISLAAASFGWLSIPSRPVEVLVAVSIIVTALHAVRPIFAGREPMVAGVFGLVHGLAFATALQGLGFHGRTLGISLLGFNLGIEAMQLAVVVVFIPFFVLLARTPWYKTLRIGGSAIASIAAVIWIVERVHGT